MHNAGWSTTPCAKSASPGLKCRIRSEYALREDIPRATPKALEEIEGVTRAVSIQPGETQSVETTERNNAQSPGAKLRALLAEPRIVVAPGVYDGFSLRLVEQAGFKTAIITGAGLSESNLGWADVGIMGYTENLRASGALAAISSIPLSADGDTGYGNALNVYFTIQGFERAGLACLMIEDQVWPKRCGHMEGKAVICAEEGVEKIRAAAEARSDPSTKPLCGGGRGYGVRGRAAHRRGHWHRRAERHPAAQREHGFWDPS